MSTDLFFVARDDGSFERVSEIIPSDQAEDDWSFQSRGAHALDLDVDGEQDLVIFGLYFHEIERLWRPGFVRYRVRSSNHERTPPACTLIPRPWLVPSMVGYGVREIGSDFFRTENAGGQIRFGTSPWPVSTYGAGTLRFASGAQVDFDCRGEPGPIVIEEPVDWLAVTNSDGETRVCIDAAVWGSAPTVVALAAGESESALDRADGCWVGPSLSQPFYVRVDGRWITHRFH